MIRTKGFIYLSAVFLMVGLLFINSSQVAFGESRYLAQKYSFGVTGSLVNPLVVDFGGTTKTIYMDKKQLEKDKALLLVGFVLNSEDMFVKQLFNSETYSVYKARLRDNNKEELIVLGISDSDNKKVKVTEICIIGKDAFGGISAMNVKGFTPVNVLNAPLQLDGNRNIILPLDDSGKLMRIYWDNSEGAFVAGMLEDPAKSTGGSTVDNSNKSTVEDEF